MSRGICTGVACGGCGDCGTGRVADSSSNNRALGAGWSCLERRRAGSLNHLERCDFVIEGLVNRQESKGVVLVCDIEFQHLAEFVVWSGSVFGNHVAPPACSDFWFKEPSWCLGC